MNDETTELDCRAAAPLISRSLEGEAGAEDGERLVHHLLICETCRNVSEQLDFLRRAMRRMGSEAPE